MKYDHPNLDVRYDTDDDVKKLFMSAKKRKEEMVKYRLLSELLSGKTINLTQSAQLYEAVNKEKMEFEELLKLHSEQVDEAISEVKRFREESVSGKYWNPQSPSKAAIKGFMPACCYYARPKEYWTDKRLINNFYNTFTKFRVSEKAI